MARKKLKYRNRTSMQTIVGSVLMDPTVMTALIDAIEKDMESSEESAERLKAEELARTKERDARLNAERERYMQFCLDLAKAGVTKSRIPTYNEWLGVREYR